MFSGFLSQFNLWLSGSVFVLASRECPGMAPGRGVISQVGAMLWINSFGV